MDKQFYIIIGRSGSGKGTQADLLKAVLEQNGKTVKHTTTGGGFREFIKGDNFVAKCAREVNEVGGLQPEFLAVWNWSNIFINTVGENDTVILDGAPRRINEVPALQSAISFLGYKNPVMIYVDVSEGWAKERLLARGRDDDKNIEEINKRMEWFEIDVLPVIDTFMRDPRYKTIHINGEQSIEDVHKEIIAKLAAN
jgi:adenylate kinase family enzyme